MICWYKCESSRVEIFRYTSRKGYHHSSRSLYKAKSRTDINYI